MKFNHLPLMAALLFTACAVDDYGPSLSNSQEPPESIQLSAGVSGVNLSTRGIGSIGDVENVTSTKYWYANQPLHFFAIKQGEKDWTQQTNYLLGSITGGERALVMDGTAGVATSQVKWPDGNAKYYPLTGVYSFYGYFFDDAVTTFTPSTDNMKAELTIDGSQDIMLGTATLSYEDKVKIINWMKTSSKLSSGTTFTDYMYEADDTNDPPTFSKGDLKAGEYKDKIQAEFNKAFSTYTARRDVHPNVSFKHQLVRLKFFIKAGDSNAINDGNKVSVTYTEPGTTSQTTAEVNKGIFVTEISIEEQPKLVVTFDNNDHSIKCESGTDTKTAFLLKQKGTSDLENLVDLQEIAPTSTTDSTAVGESLLLPSASSYNMTLKVKQYASKKSDTEYNAVIEGDEVFPVKSYDLISILPPATETENKFVIGKSYNIYITVYSLQEIKVFATLEPWKEGGDVDIEP